LSYEDLRKWISTRNLLNWRNAILIGVLVRFLLCFWTGNPDDFEVFIRTGYYVAHGASPTQQKAFYVEGLGQPTYPYVSGLGYPSPWGLYLALAYKTYQLLPVSPYFYYFLIKLLPIAGDLIATYIIYRLALEYTNDVKKAQTLSSVFFLCPFAIFISSVWGMFDSIPILFTLISILLLIYEKPYWSAFSLGLGILFKIIPIIYLPVQLLFLRKKRGVRDAVLYLSIAMVVPFILALTPIIFYGWEISEATVTVFSQTQRRGGSLTYWNIAALLKNLFPNIFSLEALNSLFSFPPIRYLWILGLIAAYLLYKERQTDIHSDARVDSLRILLEGFSFATIGFLLTRPFVPEQFVLYLLPFLIILSASNLPKKYYWLTWGFALVFALVNFYPFAFAYLVDVEFWNIFNYLINTSPFSTVRYVMQFAIAIAFNCVLVKLLFNMREKV
jgi:hypothetical protein